MSYLHYSKYFLNTYAGTPYAEAQIPEDYPLHQVLQKSRAFRRLPKNLRELAGKSKAWAMANNPDRYGEPSGINQWYSPNGNELDPDTGQPLTDAEIDAQWLPDPDLDNFVVKDIPRPAGGFPDPNTWEPPEEEAVEESEPIPITQILIDIDTRGYEATAKEYGLTIPQLKAIQASEVGS